MQLLLSHVMKYMIYLLTDLMVEIVNQCLCRRRFRLTYFSCIALDLVEMLAALTPDQKYLYLSCTLVFV